MSDNLPVPSLGEMLPSIIRTITPMIVGFIASALLTINVVLTDGQRDLLSGLLTAVIGSLYYIAARWLEQRFPWASLLLGSRKQPVTYANSKTIIGETVSVPHNEIPPAAPQPEPVNPDALAAVDDFGDPL